MPEIFKSISKSFVDIANRIHGKKLTDNNIKKTLREVEESLINGDVAESVAKQFTMNIKQKAKGLRITKGLTSGQELVKLFEKELIILLGHENKGIDLACQPPVVILLAGLQGSGKTTSTAKLANYIKHELKKKVMVASVDVYRPAAIEQLQVLAQQINIPCFNSEVDNTQELSPLKIAQDAIQMAKSSVQDVIIIDSAGRLHIDDDMMSEIKEIQQTINPHETLFVVDSMSGQDIYNSAQKFSQFLELTGIILTKLDGDSRGGAALSLRKLTSKPIKFIGVGEKIEDLQLLEPASLARKILGMGDILSLIKKVEQKIDVKEAQKMASKISSGGSFTLNDFRKQLEQINSLGGISSLVSDLPALGGLQDTMKQNVNEKQFKVFAVIIDSMTKQERIHPELIERSRLQRIAKGCGQSTMEVKRLLKHFAKMQKMFKGFSGKGGGLKKMMSAARGLLGGKGMEDLQKNLSNLDANSFKDLDMNNLKDFDLSKINDLNKED